MSQIQIGEELILRNPKAELRVKEARPAPRLSTLQGATVAVISGMNDPDRSQADLLLRRVGEMLLREGASHVLPLRKKAASQDMPQDMMDLVSSQAQAAVVLEGD